LRISLALFYDSLSHIDEGIVGLFLRLNLSLVRPDYCRKVAFFRYVTGNIGSKFTFSRYAILVIINLALINKKADIDTIICQH